MIILEIPGQWIHRLSGCKKMEQTNHAFEIKSVYGIGYKFEVLQ